VRILSLAAVLIMVLQSEPLFAQEPSRVGVCDLFADSARWNGRMVEVRGVVETWSGYWLAGRDCDTKVRVGSVNFDNLIAPTDPALADRLALHKIAFTWDPASRNSLSEAAYYSTYLGQRLRATVVGLFETRTPKEALVNPRFPDQYFGFGDQGVAPAQIVVKDVKDIVREPAPLKPKSAQPR
jgi:hypothetical protein